MTAQEMLIADLQRELRWAYRDQSTRNLLEIAERLSGTPDASKIGEAVRKYVSALSSAHRNVNLSSFDRVKVCSYILMDEIRKWKDADADK